MNATSYNNGISGYNSTDGGFSYGIGVSIGILILITTITVASYFCKKSDESSQQQTADDTDHHVIDVGIDQATLSSYPKLKYSTKVNNINDVPEKDSTASSCSICLADYKSNDTLRLLPDCGHVFHLMCVDPWLRSHATCPLCRTSPLPTPVSTPSAEVVPPPGNRENG